MQGQEKPARMEVFLAKKVKEEKVELNYQQYIRGWREVKELECMEMETEHEQSSIDSKRMNSLELQANQFPCYKCHRVAKFTTRTTTNSTTNIMLSLSLHPVITTKKRNEDSSSRCRVIPLER